MGRYILLLLWLIIATESQAQSLNRQQLRTQYLQCTQRKTALDSFIATLESNPNLTAAEESYLGITTAMLTRYTTGMWSKYRLVVKAKDRLNSAIVRDARDPELRFMRFMLEHNLPSFLCMSTHLSADLDIIMSSGNFMDENLDLKKMAIEFLIKTKRCNQSQLLVLEKTLAEISSKKNTMAQAVLR